ncbi:MAG: dihydrofolate reductase [Vicingaceae bacterium]|nr:dihydrofolate reductase [Vicingaceae bacterium]
MIVSLIVAVAENNVIGKDNTLIWHLPKDMQFFKQTTLNHHIITGRKNYISIPEKFRPLANRTNIMLTRQNNYTEENCVVLNSLETALDFAKKNNETEVFIIGGGQIYKEAIDKGLVDKMYITHVHQSFEGDTFFPEIDSSKWQKTSEEHHIKDEKHAYDFSICVYSRI